MCKCILVGIKLPLPEAGPTINQDHWKHQAAQQAQAERMREQERARAEASASAAPESASAKPQAKAMPSRQVEWLIHNSTAVVEEVPEDVTSLVVYGRRSRQYQGYMAAEAAEKRMRKG